MIIVFKLAHSLTQSVMPWSCVWKKSSDGDQEDVGL